MIELSGVGLKRGGAQLFDGFNLGLPDAGVYAVTGPAGSGKSLLGRLLCGRLRPQQGKVRVDGHDLYQPFGFNRPPLWHWDALSDLPWGQTCAEYVRSTIYLAGGNPRDGDELVAQLSSRLGVAPGCQLEALSSGQRAALQFGLACQLPLRGIVLDHHLNLLDAETAEQCVVPWFEQRRNPDCFIVLLGTHFSLNLADLRAIWQLRGGLPAALQTGMHDTVREARQTLRLTLRGGRERGRAYLSGQHYRVLGLLERGIRIEPTGSVAAALDELQADGLVFQSIEFE